MTFSASHAICVSAGGYVSTQEDNVYHFPLSAVNLETGLDRPLLLSVPFEGSIELPQTNLSRTHGPDGCVMVHVVGPYLLAVTQLRIEGTRLLVTLGMEGTSSIVEFDLSDSQVMRSSVAGSN